MTVLRGAVNTLAEALFEQPGRCTPEKVEAALADLTSTVEPVLAQLAVVAAADAQSVVAQVLAWLRRSRLLLAESDLDGACAAVIAARTVAFRLATAADLGPDIDDPNRWRD